MSVSSFKIQTEQFEGPLDLLLSLIEKRKLHINDISLAEVSDEFVQHVESKKEHGFPLEEIADFLIVASTLLLIKSKSLLPILNFTDAEEESIDDLERRLKLYKRMRELAKHIREHFGVNILFPREVKVHAEPIFSPHESITDKNMHAAIGRVLHNLPKEEQKLTETKVQQVISLEDMVDKLSKRIQKGLNMRFSDFMPLNKEEKVTVIVGFLAMLELVKQGMISVQQDKMFSDIMMETKDAGTPQYH